MPIKDVTAFLYVDLDAEKGLLHIRSHVDGPFSRFKLTQALEAKQALAACAEYWMFVDKKIRDGHLSSLDIHKLRSFYDLLTTKSTKLAKTILDSESIKKIWTLARQCSVLVVITDFLEVPWEALFDPLTKSFLSDNCVLLRWPCSCNGERTPIAPSFVRQRIVCLDPVIAYDDKLKIEDVHIHQFLETHFGMDLHLTDLKSDLVQKVRSTRIIQWICEHGAEGLRLAADVFYTSDDSEAHPFESGSILILTSCNSAATKDGRASVAASISYASQCTVVAPSSVIVTTVGVRFARTIDCAIQHSQPGSTVVDIWRALHVKYLDVLEDSSKLTPEACFVLWYGIYGSGDLEVKGR